MTAAKQPTASRPREPMDRRGMFIGYKPPLNRAQRRAMQKR